MAMTFTDGPVAPSATGERGDGSRGPGRPPKTAAEHEDTRLAIFEAAARVLDRHATAQVPVQEILQEAGVSRATFYNHFGSKDRLLEGLFELASWALLEAIRAAVEPREGLLDRLRAGVAAYLDFHRTEAGVVAALQAAALRPGSRLHRMRAELHARLIEYFQSELARAGRSPADPLLLRGILSALEGISLEALASEEPRVLGRAEDAMLQIAVVGLLPPFATGDAVRGEG